jgi:antitoxin component YwqK of YwqJK toxin-antitoxin module
MRIKYYLFAVFVILNGCFYSQINKLSDLETTNNFILNKGQKYSGIVVSYNNFGQIIAKFNVKEGLIDGRHETYHEFKDFVKSNFRDSSLINHNTIEIQIKQSQLIKLENDSLQFVQAINDFINYNLGGQKKLAKMRVKNEKGQLNKKDKTNFDQLLQKELELSKLIVIRRSLSSDIKRLQEEVNKEFQKPDFIPSKKLVYEVQSGQKNGTFKKFNEKGEVLEEGIYIKDKQEGEWRYYHPNRNMLAIGNFEQGDGGNLSSIGVPMNGRNGKWKTFFPSGNIAQETDWFKGLQNGLQKYYFESGQIEEESTFKNDKMDGYAKFFYLNGNLKGEGIYRDGNRGDVSEKGIPRNGREGKWLIYYKNGKIEQESFWSKGLLNGMYKSFNDSGILIEAVNYKNGKEDGIRKEYFDSGKLKEETTFKNGKKHGPAKSYFENGKIEASVNYDTTSLATNQLIGNCYQYKQDGTLEFNYFISKNGKVEDKMQKPVVSSQKNSTHKCSWCGKSFQGLGWTVGKSTLTSRCEGELNNVDWGEYGDWLGWYCSKKCAVENCYNKD